MKFVLAFFVFAIEGRLAWPCLTLLAFEHGATQPRLPMVAAVDAAAVNSIALSSTSICPQVSVGVGSFSRTGSISSSTCLGSVLTTANSNSFDLSQLNHSQ